MQQKKWMDEKNKIPTNKMTNPFEIGLKSLKIKIVSVTTF